MPKVPVSVPQTSSSSSNKLPAAPDSAGQVSPDSQLATGAQSRTIKTRKQLIRFYSGTVLALVLSYAVAGVLWAWLRPTYTATPVGDGQYQLGDEINVEFVAYLWFLGLTAVIAVVAACLIVSHYEDFLSPKLYGWVVLWIVLGQFTMIALSNVVVSVIHPVLDDAVVQYAPSVSLGALGYVLAPCLAALIMWVGMLYQTREEPPAQLPVA